MAWYEGIRGSLRESLFRNSGIPYRNLIGLLLGYIGAIMLLSSGLISNQFAGWIFVVLLFLIMLLLVVVRPYRDREVDRFAWGVLVVITLGFGLGALIHQYREWWRWLWFQYLRINEPHELLLEALFLVGVILGFFVVRNWAKEQKDFVSSLSAVLGASFVATMLGTLQDELGPMKAFSYYAIGFALSGALNLIVAARLTSSYVNRRSLSNRAALDFLYGSERAKIIDGYFLKNFQEDPDYARRWLTDALLEFRKLAKREFASRMEARRVKCAAETKRYERLQPEFANLKTEQDALRDLQDERKKLMENNARDPNQEARLQQIENELPERNQRVEQIIGQANAEHLEEWQTLKPKYHYEMIAIEEETSEDETSAIPEKEREHNVLYKVIGSNKTPAIEESMFRVGVAMRWQDVLEYIIAPGPYGATFPYFGSVAGLALLARQTVVMDRDLKKRFRYKDTINGTSPKDIEQSRGLDEIHFLSYITIPLVNRLGSATENGVGIVNIDTKLFATDFKLGGTLVEAGKDIYRAVLTPIKLTEYAASLYEQDDKDVKYIEELTKIIVPVLELYSKSRVGAI